MASHGTVVQRPSAASEPFSPNDESRTFPTSEDGLKIVWPFSIPSTEEAALARISKNFRSLASYYALFVYLVLLIALIPQRKVSLVFLVVMREITSLYLLLLRALPNSIVLHKIIDKRLIFFLLSIIAGVALILTHAAIHLMVTVASSVPVIFVHAVLWKEDLFVKEDDTAAGESLLPL